MIERITHIAPGIATIARYRSEDLPHDVAAGLSVAAVALPVGVAYAQLAGFNPAVGLYSSILPLVAYALFGSSRQHRRPRCCNVRVGRSSHCTACGR
jgi:MFS superfamily sulfate permease-like transporter